MIALLLSLASADPSALEQAYEREYAYLIAERDSLNERLIAVRTEVAPRLAATEAELSTLEAQWVRHSVTADALARRLDDVEREADSARVAAEGTGGTLQAARATLEKNGVSLPSDEADVDAAAALAVREGVALIRRGAQQTTRAGDFFTADGAQVSGSIVTVGHIAAWGVSDDAAGALVPAGDGHWRLWAEPAADTARGLLSGASPALAGAYLLDDATVRVDEPEATTWLTVARQGGVVGVVILVLGAIAGILAGLRALTLLRLGAGAARLLRAVQQSVAFGEVGHATTLASKHRSAMGRALTVALPHVYAEPERRQAAVEEAMLTVLPSLERFSTAILVIAAVAPLLGLLGTVTGMIATFDVLTRFGTGDPKMLSGGISEALVTTQLGLIVAIPAVLVGNLLSARGRGLSDTIEAGLLSVIHAAEPNPVEHLNERAAK